jgi:hypothetical protein
MSERELAKELERIAADNLAMQLVLNCLLRSLYTAVPSVKIHILKAFDDAANYAENFSIAAGSKAGHLPETLRIIEQMRAMLVGQDKPNREV